MIEKTTNERYNYKTLIKTPQGKKYNMKKNDDFTRNLLKLVLPIAFGQFMLALVSASDAWMLGALSQDALSAVSLAGQIFFVESLFLTAMTIGLSIFAAQFWGCRDIPSLEKIFAYVLRITLVMCFLFFFGALFFPGFLMGIFTNDETLIALGSTYLRSVAPAFLLTGISQNYLCILRNSNRAGLASIISAAGVLANIALNALLIFGLLGLPKLGITGAAVATVLARVLEILWCLAECSRKPLVSLRWSYFCKHDNFLRKKFWKYTAPVLCNEIVWGIGFTMFSVILGHLGSDAVAANSLACVVKNLTVCFCLGLGSGGGIMVGNALGAGELETAKAYGKRLTKLSVLAGAASGIAVLALTPLVLHFSNLSAQATHYLQWMLVICSYYLIGKSVNSTAIAGIFCAGGDSKFGLICDAITMWVIIVPAGLVAAFVLKLPVLLVYFILNLDEIIKLPAVYWNYKKYNWVRNLTGKEEF